VLPSFQSRFDSNHFQVFGIASTQVVMAKIGTTARLTNEGGEVDVTETTPISEVMKDSSIVALREGKHVLEKSNSRCRR
jgi:hypothetical protein